jgi:hypothetical protein
VMQPANLLPSPYIHSSWARSTAANSARMRTVNGGSRINDGLLIHDRARRSHLMREAVPAGTSRVHPQTPYTLKCGPIHP